MKEKKKQPIHARNHIRDHSKELPLREWEFPD
jgi:hypothetical protein